MCTELKDKKILSGLEQLVLPVALWSTDPKEYLCTMNINLSGLYFCLTLFLCDFNPFLLDISISLLSLVVTACGLALFGVSLFVSWKLCWIPWRERGLSPGTKEGHPDPPHPPPPPLQPQPIYTEVDATLDRRNNARGSVVKEPTVPPTPVSPAVPGSPPAVPVPEAALKISHTSPDIPLEVESKTQENGVHGNTRMQRQITDPSSTCVR